MGRRHGEETICTMRLKVVVPHRKERGHSNGRYHDWRSWSHPTRRSERRRTLSSEELGDEIRLLPGRQSHRHPVFDHCALDWIGGSGVVVADAESFRKRNHDSSIFTRPFSTESTHFNHLPMPSSQMCPMGHIAKCSNPNCQN